MLSRLRISKNGFLAVGKSIWIPHFNFILFGINIDYSIHFWLYIQQGSIFVENVCLFPDCKMDFFVVEQTMVGFERNIYPTLHSEMFIHLKCTHQKYILMKRKHKHATLNDVCCALYLVFILKKRFLLPFLHAMQCSLYLFILFAWFQRIEWIFISDCLASDVRVLSRFYSAHNKYILIYQSREQKNFQNVMFVLIEYIDCSFKWSVYCRCCCHRRRFYRRQYMRDSPIHHTTHKCNEADIFCYTNCFNSIN